MTVISIDSLPAPEQITCTPLRTAAEALRDARAALNTAKRDLIEARQREVPEAALLDAREDKAARHARKTRPRKRAHTEAAERRIADLEHEVTVCELARERAPDTPRAALRRARGRLALATHP